MSHRLGMDQGQRRERARRDAQAAAKRARRTRRFAEPELLEARALLAVTHLQASPPVDVSKLPGNQFEPSIAINPTNPRNIVMVSANNNGSSSPFKGLSESFSFDGGSTWNSRVIADGFGSMVPALGVPSLAFDKFGNLFLSYADTTRTEVVVSYSADGGLTFKCFATLPADFPADSGTLPSTVSRPSLAVGPGTSSPSTVWVAYQSIPPSGALFAAKVTIAGAPVFGLGNISPSFKIESVPEPPPVVPPIGLQTMGGNYTSIAVAPSGAVTVSWLIPSDLAGPALINDSIDPDGLGPVEPTEPNHVALTAVGGNDYTPPQPVQFIDAAMTLAYDSAPDAHHGRLYIVYTDATSTNAGCTDIGLRYSDNNGVTWTPSPDQKPLIVNDNTLIGETAEILPHLSVDPITGHLAVGWLSARNDPGFGPGDRDGHANDDVEEFVALSTDGGQSFSPNIQVSAAPSNAYIANHANGNDFGRKSGVAIFNDTIFAAWPDNSTILAGNPEPNNFDIAVSKISQITLTATGLTPHGTINIPLVAPLAVFTDFDLAAPTRTAADYLAAINWGDGTTTRGIVTHLNGTSYAVSGAHTYVNAKHYPIQVTVVDSKDGNVIRTFATAIIQGVDVVLPPGATLTAGSVVDTNKQTGNQAEEAIAINPTNPNNIVVVANNAADKTTQLGALPVVESVSFDGGNTWKTSNITDGYGGLVAGFGDPSLVFDQYGNLFLSTLDSTKKLDAIALSVDGGLTFKALATYEAGPHARNVADQPTIAVGPGSTSPGSVWITFATAAGGIAAVGAPVYGKGIVGQFAPQENIQLPNIPVPPGGANFGDVTIGPNGQVMVTYQVPTGDQGPSMIFTNVDPDGLAGAGFGAAIPVPAQTSPFLPFKTSTTYVGGFDPIPAQPIRSIDAEVGVAYDRSNDSHNGRVYMVYTDASALESPNTDIYLRYSDNNGFSWSNPVKVNDDNTEFSQFLPRIAVDPLTGHIAVSWYDARNDPGFGPGDRDGLPNDDVEVYAAVSTNGGLSFTPNIQVQASPSESKIANHNSSNDFGDYTGLAFYNDVLYPAWADNSVTLAGNPDPKNFDIATARVGIQFPVPINGMPSPGSITGVLNGNKITNNNRPTFIGTTLPGSFVQLFAEPVGGTVPVVVGSTFAGPNGIWSITSVPLPDGTYSFFVQATTPQGHTTPITQILPGGGMGFLVIDTVGPKVTGLAFGPVVGQIVVTMQDDRSGLDPASLVNPANYGLVQGSRPAQAFGITNILVTPPLGPTFPQTVLLTFNGGAGLRGLNYLFRVVSGGVRDAAGNALDGEFFGYFPSGNGIRGGDFVARLDSIHHTIFPAQPTTPPVVPITGAASFSLHDLALSQVGSRRRRGH